MTWLPCTTPPSRPGVHQLRDAKTKLRECSGEGWDDGVWDGSNWLWQGVGETIISRRNIKLLEWLCESEEGNAAQREAKPHSPGVVHQPSKANDTSPPVVAAPAQWESAAASGGEGKPASNPTAYRGAVAGLTETREPVPTPPLQSDSHPTRGEVAQQRREWRSWFGAYEAPVRPFGWREE